MKKIILLSVTILFFLSCEKQPIERAPTISYKIGIVNNTILNKKTLGIEFSSDCGEIEEVYFEGLIAFEINNMELFFTVDHNDFLWKKSENTIEGICKESLGGLVDGELIHQNTIINGKIKIKKRWWRIPPII